MAKYITPKNIAFVGIKRAILTGQDRAILSARVANQNTGFASSCLLSHIIMVKNVFHFINLQFCWFDTCNSMQNKDLLIFKLLLLIGISTTEKNLIPTREKL